MASQRKQLDIKTLDPMDADSRLGEWRFRADHFGDWRGWSEDGRKTALKSATKTHSGMENAQNDVLNGRILCPKWLHCQHYIDGRLSESPEACAASARYHTDRLTFIGFEPPYTTTTRKRENA